LCFNNGSDFEATKLALSGMFPNSINILIPTETCKAGSTFTPTSEELIELWKDVPNQEAVQFLVRMHMQWTALQRGVHAPLFDVVPLISLEDLHTHAGIVKVDVIYCDNPKPQAIGTIFEKMGMNLEPVLEDKITMKTPLTRGKIYAVNKGVKATMNNVFREFLTKTFER